MTNKKNILYFCRIVTRSFFIAILCFMLIPGFLFFIYMGDLLLFSNNSQMKNPLFGAYVIVSPSMVPTISVNDGIVIKRVDNDQYDVGDIITFVSNDVNYKGLLVTHRIVHKKSISKNESIYTTKGDNNSLEDSAYVMTDAICGKVLFRIPKIGYVKDFFSKPIHYFLCLLIPAFIFVFYDIHRIISLFKKKRI